MRGNRMKTRAVSFLLALAMILTMVPAQNLQAAEPAGEQPAISTQNEETTEEKEASFGWDLTFTSLPEGGAWTWQADALTDYTARISAAQEEAENRLPAKEQTLTLTLALPARSCRARSVKSALRTTRTHRSLQPGTAQEPGTTAL